MVENFDPNTIEDEGLRQVVITLMCITPRKILPAGKILTHFLFSSYAASKSLSENLGVCGRIEKNGKEERMSRTKPWEVTDELWKHVQPLIPPAPSHAKGGRPRLPDRQSFEAIVYVLRTGIQWNALPRELGASSTVHDRFQEWEQAAFFKALWQAGLHEYDDLQGIQWEWQAVDGVMTKAPFGHAATGANPTDRGKCGTKRSLLTDGAGIPLAFVVDGANRHDVKLLSATLDGLVISRPEPTEAQPQHVCLDAAYDSTPVYKELLARHYQPHVRSRGEEKREKEFIPGYRARRWVVERTHSWINRSRRLLVRWEKKVENYLAFLHLACAQLIFAKVTVFG